MINNKLNLAEAVDGKVIIYAENEDVSVAEVHDCTPDIPETQFRAKRLIECYNLFLGIENPTEYMEGLMKGETE